MKSLSPLNCQLTGPKSKSQLAAASIERTPPMAFVFALAGNLSHSLAFVHFTLGGPQSWLSRSVTFSIPEPVLCCPVERLSGTGEQQEEGKEQRLMSSGTSHMLIH